MVILFSTKCFLFVYIYIDLFNLKPINCLKIVMLTSPGFFFFFFFFFLKKSTLWYPDQTVTNVKFNPGSIHAIFDEEKKRVFKIIIIIITIIIINNSYQSDKFISMWFGNVVKKMKSNRANAFFSSWNFISSPFR